MVLMSEPHIPLGNSRHLSDEEFLTAFEGATLTAEQFRHADHVRMAWIYLRRMPLLEALSAFGVAIQRLAVTLGAPDLYHETVTWAFLILVNERLQSGRDGADWPQFAARNADLLHWKDGPFFERYSAEVLDSAVAKRCFVLPTPLSSAEVSS